VETVSITIPAAPAYLQVVRLVAAGLAARLKFTLEDIEDLKIAVDELSAYLTGAQGRDGKLHVTFSVHDDRIEIAGRGEFTSDYKIRTHLTELSQMILQTVVDDAQLKQDNGTPSFSLVKSKGQ
jgi:serine/threonine-protein kinase RsbW